MNERQRDYFRAKLLAWKDEILREAKITLQTLQEENVNHPDLADRASSETDRAIELRARDRQRKLISKIDEALRRIDEAVERRRFHCLSDPFRQPGVAREPVTHPAEDQRAHPLRLGEREERRDPRAHRIAHHVGALDP